MPPVDLYTFIRELRATGEILPVPRWLHDGSGILRVGYYELHCGASVVELRPASGTHYAGSYYAPRPEYTDRQQAADLARAERIATSLRSAYAAANGRAA